MPRLADMTWNEVRAGAVAILPVGATEAHGPHLPLGTDVLIAEAMAGEAARRLEALGVRPILLPPLAYTAAPFAAEFPGTISVPAEVVTLQVTAIARAASSQGFTVLALANAHLDPAHVAALHDAAGLVRHEGLLRVAYPDLTRRPWAERLTEEFRSGACHAGRYEGSIVMAVAPRLVREDVRRALPAVEVSLSRAIRAGRRTFREAGGSEAYFGQPADATAEEGRRTIETLGLILEEAVMAELAAMDAPGGGGAAP